MNQLFLFVRPPRPLWPFNSPATAFWPPLAFASLAAMLRAKLPDLRVEILDAPALQMGWRSLGAEIHRRQPAYVGIGEEAVSCVEGLRLARLAKACGAQVIAGGCFFGHVAAEVLATGLVDAVVHGEGELTLVELVEVLRQGSSNALSRVRGISFLAQRNSLKAGQSSGTCPAPGFTPDALVSTPPRSLIPDLDNLPLPAYDLLPVERYGGASRNHPHLAAIELGRGCVGSCDFCVLWRQMGQLIGGRLAPRLRTKSPERLMEEIRLLAGRYGRRYLGWVDPCFNADPHVPGELAELMLRKDLRLGQSAWVRSDALVRDGTSGALASCVRAGLNEIYVGIERPDPASLESLHKSSGLKDARQALNLLRRQYPEVLVVGSFIYGLPGDSPQTVWAIHRLAIELELDQFFAIPLTPLPGTMGWRPELWDSSGQRFREFNFLPSGRPHGRYASLERALLCSTLFNWPVARWRIWQRHFFGADGRKRRVHRRLCARGARFHLATALKWLLGGDRAYGLVFPKWYDS